MRRIPQFLPAILILRALSMLARKDILHQHCASRSANTRHFANDSPWLLHVVQREAADYHIKAFSFERQVLRVPHSKRNIRESALFGALFPNRQHRRRQIDPDDFPRGSRKSFRDVPGPRRYIQYTLSPLQPGGRHQPANSFFVRNPRIRCERFRLRREGLADHIVVLRHGSAFPEWERKQYRDRILHLHPHRVGRLHAVQSNALKAKKRYWATFRLPRLPGVSQRNGMTLTSSGHIFYPFGVYLEGEICYSVSLWCLRLRQR